MADPPEVPRCVTMCRKLMSLLCQVFMGVREVRPEAATLINWGDAGSPKTPTYVMMWAATAIILHSRIRELKESDSMEADIELMMMECEVADLEKQARKWLSQA